MLKWFFAANAALLTAQGTAEIDPAIPETIEIADEENGRMTIPVRIAGHGPYDFIVDTGSQGSTISQAVSRELGLLETGNIRIIAASSTSDVPMVQASQIQFGSTVLDNRALPVLQGQHMGADGIIGLDSLQDMRVEINFKKNHMEVTRPTRKRSWGGYEILVKAKRAQDQLIITDARLNGVKATVIIDTGAEGSIANTALRDNIKARNEGYALTRDVNGEITLRNFLVAKELRIHGFALRNLPVIYSESPVFEALGLNDKPAIILGMQHLRLFDRIAIDFSSGKILFDLPTRQMRTGTILPPR